MLIFLAFVFFTCAYFAEPIAQEWPTVQKYATNVRGFFDDFSAGDPSKIIYYKTATAEIMEHGFESANIKYAISGYYMTTGISARNEQERLLLQATPNGSGLNVYYDPNNPTIVVMQPTYNEALRKMKGVYIPKGGYKGKRTSARFVEGYGYSPIVNYVRLACIIVGGVLLYLGAQPPKADPFDGFIRQDRFRR
ncbi:hypothetical protein KF707_08350 [Candidatus Obscuribacterales bacterium]|jgi:hypothetical protein|nr:hypothetical protein [Candidatus Obscuribacterales bacterium]MBX3136234.1 hypothetical protein [Candidatus Obscuribacterales bacterium]MBX3153769.1 hypothetical protein [Candidatus Obscuribacterales bacterium]